LVKVEKTAVLRKMKEQQKLSCSCAVCGRKRTELEVYEEKIKSSGYPLPLKDVNARIAQHIPEKTYDEEEYSAKGECDDDGGFEDNVDRGTMNVRDFNFGNSLRVQGRRNVTDLYNTRLTKF
jgi:hypothetical protein